MEGKPAIVLGLLEDRGFSQSDLARRLHVSRQVISQQLRQARVRPSVARAIAAVLGVGLKRIATLDGVWLREEDAPLDESITKNKEENVK